MSIIKSIIKIWKDTITTLTRGVNELGKNGISDKSNQGTVVASTLNLNL